MTGVMVIPAAGRGSRLGASGPKVLHPVAGRPMIDRLVDLYAPVVEAFVLVVRPDVEPLIRGHRTSWPRPVSYAHQPEPTGMLDAMLSAGREVAVLEADHVWITWCDQVGVLPETIHSLAGMWATKRYELLFPTVTQPEPYIHFQRDGTGRIVDVLHRREGDAMPDSGESDIGLFVMSASAFCRDLQTYARHAHTGARTGERNFLPFIAWLASRAEVATMPATDVREAIGVNTQEDRRLAERFLRDGP